MKINTPMTSNQDLSQTGESVSDQAKSLDEQILQFP